MLVSTVLVQALFAITALAVPSSHSRHSARVARRARSGVRQSRPKAASETHPNLSSNWAGAVLNSDPGTYTSVAATFTVPTPQEPAGASGSHSSSAWVGIDGDTCASAILQTGVDFTVNNGNVSYDAWYEWFPAPTTDFTGISFSSGDVVTLNVTAINSTSGVATIINTSKGLNVSQLITSTIALCQQDAEWIVEDFNISGSAVPFANFGNVTFTGASAITPVGLVGPVNGTVLDIQQNGTVLTTASVLNSSVTVSYSA